MFPITITTDMGYNHHDHQSVRYRTDFSGIALIAFHAYSLEVIMGALPPYFYQEYAAKLSVRSVIVIMTLILSIGFPMIYAFDIFKQGLVRHETRISRLFRCKA